MTLYSDTREVPPQIYKFVLFLIRVLKGAEWDTPIILLYGQCQWFFPWGPLRFTINRCRMALMLYAQSFNWSECFLVSLSLRSLLPFHLIIWATHRGRILLDLSLSIFSLSCFAIHGIKSRWDFISSRYQLSRDEHRGTNLPHYWFPFSSTGVTAWCWSSM